MVQRGGEARRSRAIERREPREHLALVRFPPPGLLLAIGRAGIRKGAANRSEFAFETVRDRMQPRRLARKISQRRQCLTGILAAKHVPEVPPIAPGLQSEISHLSRSPPRNPGTRLRADGRPDKNCRLAQSENARPGSCRACLITTEKIVREGAVDTAADNSAASAGLEDLRLGKNRRGFAVPPEHGARQPEQFVDFDEGRRARPASRLQEPERGC